MLVIGRVCTKARDLRQIISNIVYFGSRVRRSKSARTRRSVPLPPHLLQILERFLPHAFGVRAIRPFRLGRRPPMGRGSMFGVAATTALVRMVEEYDDH